MPAKNAQPVPTSHLSLAVSRNSRPAFILALLDADQTQPGWADDAMYRALYSPDNAVYFLKEMIKKGVKPGPNQPDLMFSVAMLHDNTGQTCKLLLKAGYKPSLGALLDVAKHIKAGRFGAADKLFAAAPKAMRADALAHACVNAVFAALPAAQLDKLDRLWGGKPDALAITQGLFYLAEYQDFAGLSVERRAIARGWISAASLQQVMDKGVEQPGALTFSRHLEEVFLEQGTPLLPAATSPRRRM